MSAPGARLWTDERIAHAIGSVLRYGVMTAAGITTLGAALFLWHHGGAETGYRVFHREPIELRTVRGTVAAAITGEGRAIIQIGLLLLIATPVARVAFALIGFARERDWRFVGITALVLGLLCFSLFLARA